VVFPGFQPMSVSEEPVRIYLFRQNPVFISLHLISLFHVVPPLLSNSQEYLEQVNHFLDHGRASQEGKGGVAKTRE